MTPTQPSQAVEAAEIIRQVLAGYADIYQKNPDGPFQGRSVAADLTVNVANSLIDTLRAELAHPREVDAALSAARIRCGAVDPQRPCDVNCAGCEGCCGNLPPKQGDAKDAERLNFVLTNTAWVQTIELDHPGVRWQCMTQDEDENYIVLSGDNKSFATPREAIDAAILASKATAAGEGK